MLLTLPVPSRAQLDDLTRQVAKNNGFNLRLTSQDQAILRTLRKNIKHVIYIVKENRTYDQILGDLPTGNGDPNLTQFPEVVTPNQHALAKQFVLLDNFYDPSNVSYEGWQWSTAARSVDATEKSYSVNYAKRGLSYDSEGTDRGINVAYPNIAARRAANERSRTETSLRGEAEQAQIRLAAEQVETRRQLDRTRRLLMTGQIVQAAALVEPKHERYAKPRRS